MENNLTLVGFKELNEFFTSLPESERKVKAEDIQKALSNKHSFSSGKITGIIKRANDNGMIKLVSRGIYEYCPDYVNNKNFSPIEKINEKIKALINDIKTICAQNMMQMSINDFELIKNKIEIINESLNN